MFEPNPRFFKILENKTRKNKSIFKIFNFALGAEIGSLPYFYDSQSFIAESAVGYKSKIKTKNSIDIRTIESLHDISLELDFLKSDVEEMDFLVLVGAGKKLKDIRYLQFELGVGAMFQKKRVTSQDYWTLLEPDFKLFILRDNNNPIWQTNPKLRKLIPITPHIKVLIEILQRTGVGFNVAGINRSIEVQKTLSDQIDLSNFFNKKTK